MPCEEAEEVEGDRGLKAVLGLLLRDLLATKSVAEVVPGVGSCCRPSRETNLELNSGCGIACEEVDPGHPPGTSQPKDLPQ